MKTTVNLHSDENTVADCSHQYNFAVITFRKPDEYSGITLFGGPHMKEAFDEMARIFNAAQKIEGN